MEEYRDRLLAALSHISSELVSDVRGAVTSLQRLEALHFEKEESLFYPKLRPAFPDLLPQMDLQHQDIREVEQHVSEMLTDRRYSPAPLRRSRGGCRRINPLDESRSISTCDSTGGASTLASQ